MREATARALGGWPTWLPRGTEMQVPLVGYGGRAFTEDPALAERVPGRLLGATLDEGSRQDSSTDAPLQRPQTLMEVEDATVPRASGIIDEVEVKACSLSGFS